MRENVINCPVFDTMSSEQQWRRDACLAVRAHLCNHPPFQGLRCEKNAASELTKPFQIVRGTNR